MVRKKRGGNERLGGNCKILISSSALWCGYAVVSLVVRWGLHRDQVSAFNIDACITKYGQCFSAIQRRTSSMRLYGMTS